MYRADGRMHNPALTCPHCGADARPSPKVQRCEACRRLFTLHAGALLDASVVPPPYDPAATRLVVKSAGIALHKRAVLAAEGVSSELLDPVVALVPVGQSGVLYPEIASVAVYRKVDLALLAGGIVLVLPLALLLATAAIVLSLIFLAAAVPMMALSGFMVWRGAILKAHWARVTGAHRIVTIRFDHPFRHPRHFHDELLRRAGIGVSPIP